MYVEFSVLEENEVNQVIECEEEDVFYIKVVYMVSVMEMFYNFEVEVYLSDEFYIMVNGRRV